MRRLHRDLGLGRRLLLVVGRLLPLVLELERLAITSTQKSSTGLTRFDPDKDFVLRRFRHDARVRRSESGRMGWELTLARKLDDEAPGSRRMRLALASRAIAKVRVPSS